MDHEFRNLSLLIHANLVIKIKNMITSRDLPLKSRDFTLKIQGNFKEGLVSMMFLSNQHFEIQVFYRRFSTLILSTTPGGGLRGADGRPGPEPKGCPIQSCNICIKKFVALYYNIAPKYEDIS